MKMCFWNVGGIISKYNYKTNDPLFLKNIEKYDIVFLAETHAGPNLNFSKIGSFHDCHAICRKQSKHNKRYFGGLAVMIKNKLKPYIKIRNNTNLDYQWVKLEKKSFWFLRGYLYLLCVLSA